MPAPLPAPPDEILNMLSIPFRNGSQHAIKIDADLIPDDVWPGNSARPVKVSVPAGAIIRIRAEFCARELGAGAQLDPDTGLPVTSSVRKPIIAMVAPQLVPHGPDAERFFAEVFHHQLPSVKRTMAELARRGKAERGEQSTSREAMEAEITERVRAAMGELRIAEPALASPRFESE